MYTVTLVAAMAGCQTGELTYTPTAYSQTTETVYAECAYSQPTAYSSTKVECSACVEYSQPTVYSQHPITYRSYSQPTIRQVYYSQPTIYSHRTYIIPMRVRPRIFRPYINARRAAWTTGCATGSCQ